jgi:hypothetical protein
VALPAPFPVKRLRPDAVTAVELVWTVPPPVLPLPRPRPGVLASPLAPPPLPSMHELTAISVAIAAEVTFDAAALRFQREARRLTRSTEALCVGFDWPRRIAWTVHGRIANEAVKELVAQVAGSGRWSLLGNALLLPIGAVPARVVLALRRPSGSSFQLAEAAMVSALCGGVAPTFERLIATSRP